MKEDVDLQHRRRMSGAVCPRLQPPPCSILPIASEEAPTTYCKMSTETQTSDRGPGTGGANGGVGWIGDEDLVNPPSLPPDRRPSLRPATAHYPTATHHPKAPAWTSRVRKHQVRGACVLRRSACLAAATHHPFHPHSTPPSWWTAAGPAPPLDGAGPRNLALSGAASRPPVAGITWVPAFGLTPPVDLQAPQTKKRPFKSGRRGRPPNLLQFKLTAFLVPAPGSVSRASECIDRGC